MRGGWKMWDFAPERRGTAPWSRWVKLKAPGMVVWGLDCVIEMKDVRGDGSLRGDGVSVMGGA